MYCINLYQFLAHVLSGCQEDEGSREEITLKFISTLCCNFEDANVNCDAELVLNEDCRILCFCHNNLGQHTGWSLNSLAIHLVI